MRKKSVARPQECNFNFFKCSICGGTRFKRICVLGLYSYKQTVSVCEYCGVICLNPRWDEKKYDEYYQTKYWGEYQPAVVVDGELSDAKDPRGLKIFNDLQQFLERDAKIIEVGCGEGDNLAVFKSNGYNHLTGLELSLDCCRKLRRRGIVCINKSLTSYILDSNPFEEFDCVILSHMIEHFVEPEKALTMISRLLKPTGVLYVLVPNFYGSSKPYSQFTTPHTFYFGKASLEMLLNNCGFIVDRHFESPGDEIALVARKADKSLSATTSNAAEYKRVLSHLKKDRMEILRITIEDLLRGILGILIKMGLRENTYLTIRSRLRQLHILK